MLKAIKRTFGRMALDRYKRTKQQAAVTYAVHALRSASKQARSAKYAFLITIGDSGWPSARLVEPIIEPDFQGIWIGTNPSLRKMTEIDSNPKVTLAFADKRAQANLVIYGDATIETDLALRRRYWRAQWRLFFPEGPKGEDYVLIRIVPQRMEVMDFARNIIAEPFGLKPALLEFVDGAWRKHGNERRLPHRPRERKPKRLR